jgi:hypothetical protein
LFVEITIFSPKKALLTIRGFSNLQYTKVGELLHKKVAKLVELTLPKKV